jgi:phenylalanyl-tRNA synthetase beta chain
MDIDLTSNRPDCLSHLGVARELAVNTQGEIRPLGSVPPSSLETVESIIEVPYPIALAAEVVKVEDPELCNRFTARIIKNVKIGPSPPWLVDRLEAVGERSINNVADITNYVMLELGQPMHAFDLDKLAEKSIIVRTAKTGETIQTLDEVKRQLDESMLVICDAERPVAVAGVMGGFESSISEGTTSVLLEVAYFKRESIRATSRKLGLNTEASYRFERGVDIENISRASDRATALICELAGGEAGELIDVYPVRHEAVSVDSADIAGAVSRLTGLVIEKDNCIRILSALGFQPNEAGTKFTPPTWRHDISIEEDLVEEIARHAGYENIGTELPPAFGAGEYQPNEHRENALRSALIDQGFDEGLSYSFIDTKHDDNFEPIPKFINNDLDDPFVTLQDSVIEGSFRMRSTLIPGLLDAIRLNINHQRKDLKLFELGKAFSAVGDGELPNERELFAIAITGGERIEDRSMASRNLDFYDAKGAVESALNALGAQSASFVADEFLHLRTGQSAAVSLNEIRIGSVGRLKEEIAAHYKFKQPVYVAEIDIHAVYAPPPPPVTYSALPKFPSIIRDVSFAVGRDVSFDAVRRTAVGASIANLQGITFVDIYEGKGVDENSRSLTIRFEYRSDDRTLTEEDVESAHGKLIKKIESDLGILQRI